MNVELTSIAESKIRQLGGDVCGVLVRTADGVMAVSEHGRCTRLDAGVMGPVAPAGMSERELFEQRFSVPAGIYWNEISEQYDALPGAAGFDEVEIYHGQWMAWQTAKADSAQGAEPVAFIEDDELEALREGLHIVHVRLKDDRPDCTPLYTHPQPAQQGSVPECPYPCGWDNLFKIIVENAANFARSTLEDEVPESVRQMGIDSGQYAIHLCKLVMKLSAPTGLKRPQPPKEGSGDE